MWEPRRGPGSLFLWGEAREFARGHGHLLARTPLPRNHVPPGQQSLAVCFEGSFECTALRLAGIAPCSQEDIAQAAPECGAAPFSARSSIDRGPAPRNLRGAR